MVIGLVHRIVLWAMHLSVGVGRAGQLPPAPTPVVANPIALILHFLTVAMAFAALSAYPIPNVRAILPIALTERARQQNPAPPIPNALTVLLIVTAVSVHQQEFALLIPIALLQVNLTAFLTNAVTCCIHYQEALPCSQLVRVNISLNSVVVLMVELGQLPRRLGVILLLRL